MSACSYHSFTLISTESRKMTKIIVLIWALLIFCVSAFKLGHHHSRARRAISPENPHFVRTPGPPPPPRRIDHNKNLREIFEISNKSKMQTLNHYINHLLMYGNVTVVGWQNIKKSNGRNEVRTIEFKLDNRDVPTLHTDAARDLEHESIDELYDDLTEGFRRIRSEAGAKLLTSFEKYYRFGVLDAKLYMDDEDTFYGEDNEINILVKNITVDSYSEAKKIARNIRGSYEPTCIAVMNKDDKLVTADSHLVPELIAEIEEQEDASLEQMEAALKFTVEGYLRDHDSMLEYVQKKFKGKFPGYNWHVISGKPLTYLNKHLFVTVNFFYEEESVTIFGLKK